MMRKHTAKDLMKDTTLNSKQTIMMATEMEKYGSMVTNNIKILMLPGKVTKKATLMATMCIDHAKMMAVEVAKHAKASKCAQSTMKTH